MDVLDRCFLCRSGGSGAARSSAAFDPPDCESRCRTERGFRRDVCPAWPALDRARELLRASLLQAFYSVRSERSRWNGWISTAVRWFVGLGSISGLGSFSVSKNRDRLLEGEIAAKFLAAVLAQPDVKQPCFRSLLGRWHAGGSLGEHEEPQAPGRGWRWRTSSGCWTQCRGGLPWQKRGNDTHASTSDPDALLYRKGAAWRPNYASSATP